MCFVFLQKYEILVRAITRKEDVLAHAIWRNIDVDDKSEAVVRQELSDTMKVRVS